MVEYLKEKECFLVHVWEIGGYGRLNKNFGRGLRESIRGKISIERLGEESGLCKRVIQTVFQLECQKEKLTHISYIFKVADFLGVDRRKTEKNIEVWRGAKYSPNFFIKFPLEVTPLWFRCVGIGDFCVYPSKGSYALVWGQKSTDVMRNLIYQLIRFKPKSRVVYSKLGSAEVINIPDLIFRTICCILQINKKDFKKLFLKRCLDIPRPFRIQVLAQLLFDDATVDVGRRNINLNMIDREAVKDIKMLCSSLGYLTSDISERKHSNLSKKKAYVLRILGKGIMKLLHDLENLISRYGTYAGLWKKHEKLIKAVNKISVKHYKRLERNKLLRNKLIKFLEKRGKATRKEIRKFLNIEDAKLTTLLRELKKSKVNIIPWKYYSLKNQVNVLEK